ncbi:MAG: glycosyltransferase family 39 protein, partial [Candidatus Omnitrophica bacterium]|nr:glycosyltransferase family 39 protein [Candidatus Omnitrophota bacterium]
MKRLRKQTAKTTKIINGPSRDLDVRGEFLIVFAAALFVLILKLLLSYVVYGTNDVTYWKFFSDVIAQHGTFKIYSLVKIYNHPPLMSWVLKFIRYITLKSGLSFQFVFRLMPIIADFLSIFVIWNLLSALRVKTRTLLCVICSINPINFLISGFHGNTDSVFIFFIFLAIYFIKNKQIFYSGLCYGLSLCIKIVAIILLPVFFFYFRTRKEKAIFIAFSAIIPLLVFLPYLLSDFHA